ncbi:hypothetical protein PLESTF_001202000 [Pleodorina starrii]|nr:hypothetical protein PLESTF_001202000 [Pleodorina starrii]
MRLITTPKVRPASFAPRAQLPLRIVSKNGSIIAAFATEFGELADGFVAEYDLANIKLEPLARRQLRDWYAAELQRASPGIAGTDVLEQRARAGDGPESKELPPLMQRRPGVPQLTVLWDLESLKPFIQQHAGSADGADSAPEQQQRPRGSRASRLTAAGLSGGASSPDLVRALDQLCRTLQRYGTVHAVHLFLRESTLSKAPVLRRQVEQLRTWVAFREDEASEGLKGDGATNQARRAASASDSSSGQRLNSPVGSAAGTGGGRRPAVRLLQGEDVHDCPMCRSAHPTRLHLLRHFAAAHQRPLMAATAADPRTHIMWTRGRAVGLPVEAPSGLRDGAAVDEGATPQGESTAERMMVSPEEFVYSRELLMRGRHLDELLASGPVAVHAGAAGTAAAVASASSSASAVSARMHSQQPSPAGRAGGTGNIGNTGSDGTLSRRGLHLHMVPAGQPAEAAAEALRQVAEALAQEQASSLPPPAGGGSGRSSGQQSGGRAAQQGRGRKGGRNGRGEEEAPDAAIACVCVVSDAEGLDQICADLQQQDMLTMAVTRVTRVPSADASLRWWAVQGGEYRLATVRPR